MSELSDIRKDVVDLTTMVREHIAETKAYRNEQGKLLNAHSDTIWDKDGKPGLATKLDRLVEIEKNRKWTIRAIGSGVIALILDQVVKFFHK